VVVAAGAGVDVLVDVAAGLGDEEWEVATRMPAATSRASRARATTSTIGLLRIRSIAPTWPLTGASSRSGLVEVKLRTAVVNEVGSTHQEEHTTYGVSVPLVDPV
jgi:hypothetical protein